MAHPNPLVRDIISLLGDDRLLDPARESGFLVRQRDLQVVPFFWMLVLGMIGMYLLWPSGRHGEASAMLASKENADGQDPQTPWAHVHG